MNRNAIRFTHALAKLPLVAILRGITPGEAVGVAEELYRQGFRLIEVPLNSPDPFASIAAIRRALPHDCLVGSGTTLKPEDVDRLAELDADLVVMPHADPAVIRRAKERGMICMPAAVTPTEAFAAIAAGADALKLFPAELVSPSALGAMRAVLPKEIGLFPVGGISPSSMDPYREKGAAGFGLGSALYKPGKSVVETGASASAFVQAWKNKKIER